MHQYVIQRDLPGAGDMSQDQLRDLARKSNGVLEELAPDVRWLQSYVVDDQIYCVYEARDPGVVEEHARRGGFPCDRISEVKAVISPDTAKD